jgi:hypothetical protein
MRRFVNQVVVITGDLRRVGARLGRDKHRRTVHLPGDGTLPESQAADMGYRRAGARNPITVSVPGWAFTGRLPWGMLVWPVGMGEKA